MKCVILFRSIHEVMRAEKCLKGKGIEFDLIPVPREISSDCGVALEVSEESEGDAALLFRENRIIVLERYCRDPGGGFSRPSTRRRA